METITSFEWNPNPAINIDNKRLIPFNLYRDDKEVSFIKVKNNNLISILTAIKDIHDTTELKGNELKEFIKDYIEWYFTKYDMDDPLYWKDLSQLKLELQDRDILIHLQEIEREIQVLKKQLIPKENGE